MTLTAPAKARAHTNPGALYALLIGAFAVGMTEFVIAGLLPEIAADFDVSISITGLLVSGYAVGVAVGAPVLTTLTSRVPRKTLLLSVMILFIFANVVAALAPGYEMLLVGRVLSAFAHGVFFGVGSVIAIQVAAPGRGAAAISMIISGIAAANVLGVPIGTFIGQHLGWRATFWVVAGLGLLSVIMITVLIPQNLKNNSVRLATELAAIRRPGVLLSFALILFGYGAVALVLTYVAPVMTDVAGMSPAFVPLGLLFFGIGMFIGGPVGGRFADKNLMRTIVALSIGITVVLAVLSLSMHNPIALVATLAVLGLLGGAILPAAQLSVITQGAGGENLASSLNVSAINVGIAVAAGVGAIVIGSDLGLSALGWAAAPFGLIAVIVSRVLARVVRDQKSLG